MNTAEIKFNELKARYEKAYKQCNGRDIVTKFENGCVVTPSFCGFDPYKHTIEIFEAMTHTLEERAKNPVKNYGIS